MYILVTAVTVVYPWLIFSQLSDLSPEHPNIKTFLAFMTIFAFIYIYLNMTNNIHLHKNDLPDDLNLGNIIAVDGEFMGLNVRRDPLCLIQLSSGKSDAHIVQFNRDNYSAPNLARLLSDEKVTKIFHYARADMAHIKYYLKTDTKIYLIPKELQN